MTPDRNAPSRTPDADELAACLEAIASAQDRAAFAVLFRHFAPRIKTYLMRHGAPEGQAEDLAQEALVMVWRKAALFDRRKARASTWIFTIARNLRTDQLRRGAGDAGAPGPATQDGGDAEPAGAMPWSDPAADGGDGTPALAELLDQARAAHALREALAQLPQEQRDILHRSFFDEQPHSGIAQALGLPLGTVKSRIRLAVGHLRRQLGHLMP